MKVSATLAVTISAAAITRAVPVPPGLISPQVFIASALHKMTPTSLSSASLVNAPPTPMEMHTLREFFPVERVAAASGSEVTPQLLTKAHATAAPKTAATFPQKRVLASVHLAHGDKSAIAAYQSAGHVELPPAQKGVDEDGAMLYDDPTGVVRSVKDGTIEYRNANRELIATAKAQDNDWRKAVYHVDQELLGQASKNAILHDIIKFNHAKKRQAEVYASNFNSHS